MTPREKAQELVDKMFGIQVDNQTFHMYDTLETAKYSALIAVDLHLTELSKMKLIFSNRELHYKFYQEVRKEIENL